MSLEYDNRQYKWLRRMTNVDKSNEIISRLRMSSNKVPRPMKIFEREVKHYWLHGDRSGSQYEIL